jgi:hypothetical protein
MPGHIGTSIVSNSRLVTNGADKLAPNELVQVRQRLKGRGLDVEAMTDDEVQQRALDRARTFLEEAPTTAAEAAKIILDGVKAERWRILVGNDAHELDARVRRAPEQAYTAEFYESLVQEVGWKVG